MYLYLYAPFLRNRKYAKDLALLEGRVTDFGIAGKVVQLSEFLKFPAAIREFGGRKLSTLVVVGDDAALEEAVGHFAQSSVVLGYIPLSESLYGSALGIPVGIEATSTLAARRITKLDLGRAGNRLFLGTLSCAGRGIEVHSPTFSIFPKEYVNVEVINLGAEGEATDGLLDVVLTPFQGRFFQKPLPSTRIRVLSCRIKAAKPILLRCGPDVVKSPLQVDIVPEAVKMIVGRRVSRNTYHISRSTK